MPDAAPVMTAMVFGVICITVVGYRESLVVAFTPHSALRTQMIVPSVMVAPLGTMVMPSRMK